MIEKEDFHHHLEQVHQEILAANVCQLVRENCLHLRTTQSQKKPRRNQHHRLQPTNHHGDSRRRRDKERNRTGDPQTPLQGVETFRPRHLLRHTTGFFHPSHGAPTQPKTDGQADHAQRPEAHDPHQVRTEPLRPIHRQC